MKKVSILILVLMAVLTLKSYAATDVADEVLAVPADKTGLVEVHNKFCPISHEEVGKNGMKGYQLVYKGKIYNLCCAMCLKDFKKDPAKYSKMLDEQAAKEAAEVKKS